MTVRAADRPSASGAALDPATVRHALGEWTAHPGALYRRLATAIAAAIERGELPRGRRLPAERPFAASLAVARGTVVAAYDLLRADGWVERRQGSGTRIIAGPTDAPGVDGPAHAAGVRARRLTGRAIGPAPEVIDLGVSILPDTAFLPPAALDVSLDALARDAEHHGYHPAGIPALRARLAEVHDLAGLSTEPAQILVTTGAQQAIALTAHLLVRPGDSVIVENPTYAGAIDVYTRAGAQLVPVPTDGAGARADLVAAAAVRTRARLAYVMPSFQNPTGARMSEGRRRDLGRLTHRAETWVVEDNSLEQLSLTDAPSCLPVAAFGDPERVLTIGSLAKVFWGGLRVGWVRGPTAAIARLARVKAALDLGSSALSQAVAVRALDHYEEVTRELRRTYRHRSQILVELLGAHLPEWSHEPPAGGLSLWVRLPRGSADDLVRPAAARGVAFLPGGATSSDDTHVDHLRLSFALPPNVLAEGIDRLARAWADLGAR